MSLIKKQWAPTVCRRHCGINSTNLNMFMEHLFWARPSCTIWKVGYENKTKQNKQRQTPVTSREGRGIECAGGVGWLLNRMTRELSIEGNKIIMGKGEERLGRKWRCRQYSSLWKIYQQKEQQGPWRGGTLNTWRRGQWYQAGHLEWKEA